MVRCDRVLCLSGGLGIWTYLLGSLAIVEGAPLGYRTVLVVAVLVGVVAGVVGFIWYEGGEE